MKKIFISQPMSGRSEYSILEERQKIMQYAASLSDEPVEEIPSFITEDIEAKHRSVAYLAESIRLLADADMAFFAHGWALARGCCIEHEICIQYGIPVVEF